MALPKGKIQKLNNNEIRKLMLEYFYERNKDATSSMGKKGSAVKISCLKSDLKHLHGLTSQEVQSNLTYLISQGWIELIPLEKQFRTRQGMLIPSTTKYYQITAQGIDKIEGPGEFTVPRFQGINIQATGQNIITLGDGNQINAQFSDLGNLLVELRKEIINADIPEDEKMTVIPDIDTIQAQLARPTPDKNIIKLAWERLKELSKIGGLVSLIEKIGSLLKHIIS